MRRTFSQVDVFSTRAGDGNPLAVVLDANGLDTADMQALAAWTNLSETSFVLPPTAVGASYRLRIFTPRQELPFAGHPSVGTAHAVLDAGLAAAVDGALLQECAAGLLPLRVQGEGDARRIAVRAPRARLQPAQPDASGLLSEALQGLALGALAPTAVDNGPRWWVVELADDRQVRAMAPRLARIAALTEATQTVGLAVFGRTAAGSDHALAVRAFCPADGIPEDPVTGSAQAAIAALMFERGALGAGGPRYLASQGREMGRNGWVEVTVDADGDVWVGGSSRTVVQGHLHWPARAAAAEPRA
ncbi:MAG: PhzF family phenazine biosynthesis protein [Arenimonas sp.]|nr:PhzF family phenazine biosynthesis protein [Arenimonas sp.]